MNELSIWGFKHFCNLEEDLIGQNVRIKSIFNKEKTPSMWIYFTEGEYLFKCFSSGNSGDIINLIEHLTGKPYCEAEDMLREAYINADVQVNPLIITSKTRIKFLLDTYEVRHWFDYDVKYWKQFNVELKDLANYNIMPLGSYTLKRHHSDKEDVLKVSNKYVYGFFNNKGELFKVYSPYCKNFKFYNIRTYLQGLDQLTFKVPTLLIVSSMKDILSFNSLKFKTIECVAPSSENSYLTLPQITLFRNKYKNILTLFDYDRAGLNASTFYKKNYGINYIELPMAKDISDSIKKEGKVPVKELLQVNLKQVLL